MAIVAKYKAFFLARDFPKSHVDIIVSQHEGNEYIAEASYCIKDGMIIEACGEAMPGDLVRISQTSDTPDGAAQKLHDLLHMEFGPVELKPVDA